MPTNTSGTPRTANDLRVTILDSIYECAHEASVTGDGGQAAAFSVAARDLAEAYRLLGEDR